jgi:hypothetical protein
MLSLWRAGAFFSAVNDRFRDSYMVEISSLALLAADRLVDLVILAPSLFCTNVSEMSLSYDGMHLRCKAALIMGGKVS